MKMLVNWFLWQLEYFHSIFFSINFLVAWWTKPLIPFLKENEEAFPSKTVKFKLNSC